MRTKICAAMLSGIAVGGALSADRATAQQMARTSDTPALLQTGAAASNLTPTQMSFAALASADAATTLDTWLVRSSHTITIYAKPKVASALTILNVGPSGKVHVLYPNAKLNGGITAAHQVVQVPEPDATYVVSETKTTAGQPELILVIRSDGPVMIQGRPLLDEVNTASAHRLFPTVRLPAPALASALFDAQRASKDMTIATLVTAQPANEKAAATPGKASYARGMDLAFANDGPKGGPKLDKQVAGAIYEFEQASKAGYTPADVRLGFMHEHGIGTPPDEAKAQRWYERAVAKQNTEGMVRLAKLLAGRDKPADQTRALTLLEQAGAKGEPSAWRELASVYKGGVGVPADPAKAADYVMKALAAQDWGILEDLPSYPQPALRALQTRMKTAGHYVGPVDGIYAETFAAALGARVDVLRKTTRLSAR